jgi:hypothetical protein
MVWSHGRDELDKFKEHLKSTDPNNRFIMQMEKDNSLPLFHVTVKRKLDGSLGHTSCRKPRHIDV